MQSLDECMGKINSVLSGEVNGCILNQDCLSAMKLMPDGCVDAVVTDPIWPNAPCDMFVACDPFGLMSRMCEHLPSGVKRLAVQIGCNSDPRFLSTIPSIYPFFRVCWMEYVRPHYMGTLLYTSDICYLFGEPPTSREGNRVISGYCLMRQPNREKNGHPCPRRLQHVEWIVDKWSTQGELILDPFCGSGTTCVAAKKLGRRWIGIEISEKYADIARRRVANTPKPLFTENHAPKLNDPGLFDDDTEREGE